MSDTHFSAYRAEAAEKRTQATQLNAEADDLESKADALEFPNGKPEEKPSDDKSDNDKKKLFNR